MKEPTAEWVHSQLYRELVLEKGVQGNSKLASLSSLLSVLLCEGRSLAFFFKEISLDMSYVRVKRNCVYLREKTLLEIFLPQFYIEIALKILTRLLTIGLR